MIELLDILGFAICPLEAHKRIRQLNGTLISSAVPQLPEVRDGNRRLGSHEARRWAAIRDDIVLLVDLLLAIVLDIVQ